MEKNFAFDYMNYIVDAVKTCGAKIVTGTEVAA
jgi:hypothetical protein